ncbi:uncharacterized protein LAESUDRAFT_37813 [Laetiporus sulphureus 93-53]|uniref:Uncharacterized protein n=1 Tax=Laetiporus sulphureus 93-53 TaxID=1314785 RepID=A0A165IM92_9APHY|nr:uncharacterized protein LAESUDRAFT_37813 [Laetiporus sulphureus 93-53]KZT13275.1 hypothetical protein LAESUDRAFT_37813 [Laetiporus sulphureus 93-53]
MMDSKCRETCRMMPSISRDVWMPGVYRDAGERLAMRILQLTRRVTRDGHDRLRPSIALARVVLGLDRPSCARRPHTVHGFGLRSKAWGTDHDHGDQDPTNGMIEKVHKRNGHAQDCRLHERARSCELSRPAIHSLPSRDRLVITPDHRRSVASWPILAHSERYANNRRLRRSTRRPQRPTVTCRGWWVDIGERLAFGMWYRAQRVRYRPSLIHQKVPLDMGAWA